MEAVRYRGYRDHEYRSRGFDLEICRKKDRCVDNCDRNRNCRENCRKRVGSDKFHPRVKRSELEPGELSIESDSEDGGIYCGKEAIMLDGRRKFSSSNDRSCSTECQEPKTMEEDEEAAPMRNISSSRWAFGDDTLDDEEIVPKKRKISPLDATLELGEVSGSDKSVLTHSGSSGDRNDFMDIDGDLDNGNGSVALLGTDSEADDCSYEKTPEPVATCQRSFNMLQGCRDVNEFERLNKIDEGTYGVVFRARDKKTREVVALKKVKMEKATEGFPLTSLREINIMLSLQHPSILGVKEVVIGNMDSVFMVMEYIEHDLKALMGTMKQPFSQSEVKCLMLQLLSGANYLHDNWVLHRDLKTSNILLNNRGELKICDFGLSRQYGSPLKPYTPLVVTLWYRAPELLLGAKEYSTAIDMWSLGCIMAELLTKEPLFPGKTEVEQLDKIFRTLGTPNEKTWPGFTKLPGAKAKFAQHRYNKLHEKFPRASFIGSPTLSQAGFDLLNKLLTYDPEKRITAEEALDHAWFQEVPLPKSKDFMPTFPAQHAQDRCLRRVAKRPDPLEKLRLNELQARGVGTRGVFG